MAEEKQETIFITDIAQSDHIIGMLEITPLGYNTKIVISDYAALKLFILFCRWGSIDNHILNLALRRLCRKAQLTIEDIINDDGKIKPRKT